MVQKLSAFHGEAEDTTFVRQKTLFVVKEIIERKNESSGLYRFHKKRENAHNIVNLNIEQDIRKDWLNKNTINLVRSMYIGMKAKYTINTKRNYLSLTHSEHHLSWHQLHPI